MLALVDEEVEHHVNQGEVRRGRDRFAEFLAHMGRCYEERLKDLVVVKSLDGTRAVAEFTVAGRYQATDEGLPETQGQTYAIPAGAFMAVSGDRIARVATYYKLVNWAAQVSAGRWTSGRSPRANWRSACPT